MLTIEAKANSTFSYAGTISNLDGSVDWAVSAAVRVVNATGNLDNFTASIAKADDFATSHLWVINLSATTEQTLTWYNAAKGQRGMLNFDIKLYNSAGPDPVLYTDTVQLKLSPHGDALTDPVVIDLLPGALPAQVSLHPGANVPVIVFSEGDNPHSSAVAVKLAVATATPVITIRAHQDGVPDPSATPVQLVLQSYMRGPQGVQGAIPNIVFDVHSLPAGDPPSASQSFADGTLTIDLGLPGALGVDSVVVTTHGDPLITEPNVNTTGTAADPVFDIAVPTYTRFLIDEFVAGSDGQQARTYARPPAADAELYINGLRQALASYTVSNDTVIIPDTLHIRAGDLVTFRY